MLAVFKTHDAGFQFVDKHPLDQGPRRSPGTSASTASRCSSSCSPACCSRSPCSASPPHHDEKPYYAWLLLLEAGCIGAFLALDLFLFFVLFEIVLVPMYFLISGWGYDDRRYAAIKFFLYTMFGSAFMLVGIDRRRRSCTRKGGPVTFDLRHDRRQPGHGRGDHRPLAVPVASPSRSR